LNRDTSREKRIDRLSDRHIDITFASVMRHDSSGLHPFGSASKLLQNPSEGLTFGQT
jgi:hypothetical protein